MSYVNEHRITVWRTIYRCYIIMAFILVIKFKIIFELWERDNGIPLKVTRMSSHEHSRYAVHLGRREVRNLFSLLDTYLGFLFST